MEENHRNVPPQNDWAEVLGIDPEAAAEFASRKPLLNGPKRQHFLPRFYLQGFRRNDSSLVAVYDRQVNQIRLQTPDNTAVIGHFYTGKDEQGRKRFELEQVLSEIEGNAAPVIEKLSAGGVLSDEERSNLAIFAAMGMCRTPDLLDTVKAVNGQMVKHMTKFAFGSVEDAKRALRRGPNPPASEEELELEAQRMVEFVESDQYEIETDHQWALRMALNMFSTIAPILVERDWLLVHPDSLKQSFVTADAPLVLTTIRPRTPNFFYRGIGFANADALVVFPLTSSCLLLMFGTGGRLHHRQIGREEVRHFNLMVAERCQRFVIGRDEALLRSLADHLRLTEKKWEPKIRMG